MSEIIYRSGVSRDANNLLKQIETYLAQPENERNPEFSRSCEGARSYLQRITIPVLHADFSELGIPKISASALQRKGYVDLLSIATDPEMTVFRLRNHYRGVSTNTVQKIAKLLSDAGMPLREK